MKKNILLSVFLISIVLKSQGAIRYVTPLGAGSLNGTSWANAFPGTSLQAAISASGVGDEVWVATGTYYTTTTITRTISFNMKNDVAVYGSFAGTETLLSQRVLTSGLTSVLSGEIGVIGIGDNSYHTISNSNLNNTAIIDGFIIRDANDNRPATLTDGLGGGIYNNGSGSGNQCSPTIRNCVIVNNQAVFGAGVFNNGYNGGNSSPIISNCVISTNTATSGGGGLDNFGVAGVASPIITNCVFYNNTAVFRAGAMYCWGGTSGNANPIVLNTIFVNNNAVDGGGVVSDRLNLSGGGSSGNSNPNFRNCIFWGNTASGTGPQFFNLGGATFVATYSDINLTGQNFPHVVSGPATGNINTNPLFSNILLGIGADGNWMTTDDGLQLQSSSPCINVGDNSGLPITDILSNNRIYNSIVDMGAYEFNGCSGTPTAGSISGSTSICIGGATTLTLTGASNNTGIIYQWASSTISGGPFITLLGTATTQTVSPSATTYYVVNVTCSTNTLTSVTAEVTITVNITPTISVTSGTICSGQSFTINAIGANTYTISGGSSVVSPTINSTYTVTGTATLTGCTNTAAASVTVNALPIVSATTSNTLLCSGNSASLTATGATSYTWNTSATTAIIAISPSVTTTYTVTGVNTNGCSNAVIVTQSVSLCTGLDNSQIANQNSQIVIYPNPSNGAFIVELNTDANVIITNALGQEFMNVTLNTGKHSINLLDFANGVYILKVITGNTQTTNRLIISK